MHTVYSEVLIVDAWMDRTTMSYTGRTMRTQIHFSSVIFLATVLVSVDSLAQSNIASTNVARPNRTVYAIAVAPTDHVYIGGNFSEIDGTRFSSVAKLSPEGVLERTWAPGEVDRGLIRALALHGNTLYVGGTFGAIGGQQRSKGAAIDATTGALRPWNPRVDGGNFNGISQIQVSSDGNTVYIGGDFRGVNGQVRESIAAVDATTGALRSWDARIATYAFINDFRLAGETVYINGNFHDVAGQSRPRNAAVSASTGALLPWNTISTISRTLSGATAQSMTYYNNTVYIGGDITILRNPVVDPVPAVLAAFNGSTGARVPLNLSIRAAENSFPWVYCMSIYEGRLYFGGRFATVNNQARSGAAAYDLSSNTLMSWSPRFAAGTSPRVESSAVSRTALYLGGDFEVEGQGSRKLARFPFASTPAPTLSVTPESRSVSATSGSTTFTVGTTGTWTAQSNQSWATVSPTSGNGNGTVTVTYTANGGAASRTANISITAAGATGSPKTVMVVQASAAALTVTPESRSVSATSGSTTFTVGTTGSWTAQSNQSWATVSPTSGNGNGTVTVTYTANGGAASRTANISITAAGATGSPKTVTVVQGSAAALTVEPESRSVSSAAGTTTFSVGVAGSWTAQSNQSWATVSPTSGNGNGTVTVTYTANGGAASRTANISITAAGATGSPKTVTVVQASTSTSQPPSPPLVLNPVGGEQVNGTNILFTWVSIGATRFQVEVHPFYDFANPIFTSPEIAGTSFLWTGAPNDGSMLTWRVRAGNSTGWSDWSLAGSFRSGTEVVVEPTLVVSPSGFTASSLPGTGSISVQTSVFWSASVISGGSWLRISSGTTGFGNGSVQIAVSENLQQTSRQGSIRISGDGTNPLSFVVTVDQEGALRATVPICGGCGDGKSLPIDKSLGDWIAILSSALVLLFAGPFIHRKLVEDT